MADNPQNEAARLEALARALIHRFNNVLMGIQPHVEVIKRAGKDNERIAGSVAQIETALRRAKGTMSEVARLARPMTLEVEPLPVASWFESLRSDVQPFMNSPVDLTFESEPDLVLSADREQLTRAVVNLVMNAFEAMQQEGGAVAVKARAVDRGIEIAVIDNGAGITPEVMARVFEPLFTTKRNSAGLGLAVAQQIVEAHGGTVHVDSTTGNGTTVTMVVRRV